MLIFESRTDRIKAKVALQAIAERAEMLCSYLVCGDTECHGCFVAELRSAVIIAQESMKIIPVME